MNREQVGRRLADISVELQGLFTEWTELCKAERRQFDYTYFNCDETTGEARKRQGYRATMDLNAEKLDVERKIRSLEEERDMLRFAVKYGMEGAVNVSS